MFLEMPNGIPSHDAFGRVFACINPNPLHLHLLQWIKATQVVRPNAIAINVMARHIGTATESAQTTLPEARLPLMAPRSEGDSGSPHSRLWQWCGTDWLRAQTATRQQRCAPCPTKRRDRAYLVLLFEKGVRALRPTRVAQPREQSEHSG